MPCVFGSTTHPRCAHHVLDLLTTTLARSTAAATTATWTPARLAVVAIVGMPNVGKSSLINVLRRHATGRGNAVKVGPEPGVTRHITGIRLQDARHPGGPLLVLDTPGVLVPATRLGTRHFYINACSVSARN